MKEERGINRKLFDTMNWCPHEEFIGKNNLISPLRSKIHKNEVQQVHVQKANFIPIYSISLQFLAVFSLFSQGPFILWCIACMQMYQHF